MSKFLVTLSTQHPVEADSPETALGAFLADTSKASCSIVHVPHPFRVRDGGLRCDWCQEREAHGYHEVTVTLPASRPGEEQP